MAKKELALRTSSKPKKAEKKQKVGFLKKAARYFKDLRSEFKKIVWPTKKQVINNTLVVIVVVVIVGLFVAGLDALLSLLVRLILQQV